MIHPLEVMILVCPSFLWRHVGLLKLGQCISEAPTNFAASRHRSVWASVNPLQCPLVCVQVTEDHVSQTQLALFPVRAGTGRTFLQPHACHPGPPPECSSGSQHCGHPQPYPCISIVSQFWHSIPLPVQFWHYYRWPIGPVTRSSSPGLRGFSPW